MQTKTIIFDGGPLDNQFRIVGEEINIFLIYIQEVRSLNKITEQEVAIANKRYYKKSSKKFNGIEVFVWIELNQNKNESNNEGIKTAQI